MQYLLSDDIISTFHKLKPYGKKGEKVKEVSDHGNVLIVENLKGERFPVLKSKLIKL